MTAIAETSKDDITDKMSTLATRLKRTLSREEYSTVCGGTRSQSLDTAVAAMFVLFVVDSVVELQENGSPSKKSST